MEVAPNERPPSARSWTLASSSIRRRNGRRSRSSTRFPVKEIRVRPKTGDHDIEVKVKQPANSPEHKDKVLVNVLFRGRELALYRRRPQGHGRSAPCGVDDVAKVEKNPSMEGKRMTAIVAPRADCSVSRTQFAPSVWLASKQPSSAAMFRRCGRGGIFRFAGHWSWPGNRHRVMLIDSADFADFPPAFCAKPPADRLG